jgi:hypothetical protein
VLFAVAAPAAAITVADYAKNSDKLDGVDSSQYRFISLSPTAAGLNGGATYVHGAYGHGGITLPDTGVPSISYGVTLPPDYQPGKRLAVRLLWHTDTSDCTVSLRPNFTAVSRPGVQHQTVGNASAGLNGGGTLSAPTTANVTSATTFTLTPPKASVDPLRPGDAYLFGIFRSSSNDTCAAPVKIDGVSVRY